MKKFGFIIFTSVVWVGSAQAADSFIVDPTASVEFAPSITTSTNNSIPLINIVAPTAAGISHNKFQKFDVGTEGVIHNNSLTGAQTSILDQGTLSANPNFSTRSATTIIDEITSANASTLEGAIEVYGDSAGVIIANPNGISCNGCSFINAPNSALTTGAVSYGDTGQISIDTSGNDSSISIGEGGLNAAGYGSTTVGSRNQNLNHIARKILLEGTSDSKIWNTERVDLISGSVEYDFSNGSKRGDSPLSYVTNKTPNSATTGAQLDASLVSEVNAGKINIIATEQGLGVNLGGVVQASGSDLMISVGGALTVESTGSLTASRDVAITTNGSTDGSNAGSIKAGRNLNLTAGNDFVNQGVLQANRTVDLDLTGSLHNLGTSSVKASNVTIDAGTLIKNDDTATIASLYQWGRYIIDSGEDTGEKAAIGLANAIGQFEGVSTAVTRNEIAITLDDAVTSFLEQASLDDVDSSADSSITLSGTGKYRYIKISGDRSVGDKFKYRLKGNNVLTAPSIVNASGASIRSAGTLNLVYDTLTDSGTLDGAESLQLNSVEQSTGSSTDFLSLVPTELKFYGSYAAGAASTGAYYQPSTVSVSTAALSATYVNTELAEKVVDKDAIIFASDPFVAAQTAATSALVTTASSFVVEDREKEMASIALAEESVNAEQELALIETTPDLPIISVQQPVGTIQLGSVEQSGGLVGQTTFASDAELISISDTGVVEVIEATDEASDDSNDSEGSSVEDE